eukprot:8704953-Pyramimonas_sp.AAC.2
MAAGQAQQHVLATYFAKDTLSSKEPCRNAMNPSGMDKGIDYLLAKTPKTPGPANKNCTWMWPCCETSPAMAPM